MSLTPRELEAARLIANGANRASLSETMAISLSTVDKLLRALKTKLDVHTQTELVVAASDYLRNHPGKGGLTTGVLSARPRPTKTPPDAPAFDKTETIDALFEALHTALHPFGITHITCSRIRKRDMGGIEHMATRWSFPEGIGFDRSISPEENLAFKHAIANWAPAPLDLEAILASDFYSLIPENIRAQNEVYCAAGLVRGITYTLPGCTLSERLVISVLLQHISRAAFGQILESKMTEIGSVLLAFRNALMGFAVPTVRLHPREEALMQHLAGGAASLDEAADALGISRRAVDRLLASVRTAFGSPTNLAAMAAWHENRNSPALAL